MEKRFGNITNTAGDAVSGATVTVTNYPAGSTALIYATDEVGTPITNGTLTTDSKGYYQYYAPNGSYTETYSGTGIQTYSISDISISDDSASLAALAASSGSSLVGFIQSGTGATAETLQALLRLLCKSVTSYGAVGDGTTDDTTAIQNAVAAAIASGTKRVYFPKGTYKISSEIAVAADGVRLIFDDATISTTADISMLRIGSGAADNSAYKGCGIEGRLTLSGAGTGNASNVGLTVRNHSFGDFRGTVRITACGGGGFVLQTYGRGSTYNQFGVMEITANFGGGYFLIDSGAQVGGFINDNHFQSIRVYSNNEGTITHAELKGLLNNANRFYGFSVESSTTTDTLLKLTTATDSEFFGIRLDGEPTTVALNIAASQTSNKFYGLVVDGTITDAADATLIIGTASARPFIRFGDGSGTAANSWEIGTQIPGSTPELHIRYIDAADGFVRFPNNTEVFFGNRDGGDNAPFAMLGEDKRFDLSTLAATAIGSGPQIRFDGRFSSSGNMERVSLIQVGLRAVRFNDGRILDVLTTFADADATPTVAQGNTFRTANTGATTITDFDDELDGHRFTVIVDANTTIQHNANIKLAGGVDFVGSANDTISFVTRSSVHYETGRSVNG